MLPFAARINVLGGGSSDDVRWEWNHEMGGTRGTATQVGLGHVEPFFFGS